MSGTSSNMFFNSCGNQISFCEHPHHRHTHTLSKYSQDVVSIIQGNCSDFYSFIKGYLEPLIITSTMMFVAINLSFLNCVNSLEIRNLLCRFLFRFLPQCLLCHTEIYLQLLSIFSVCKSRVRLVPLSRTCCDEHSPPPSQFLSSRCLWEDTVLTSLLTLPTSVNAGNTCSFTFSWKCCKLR